MPNTILRRSLEVPIRRKVIYDAQRLYGVQAVPVDARVATGWPDRIFLTPLAPLWLEFKKPGETPRPLQSQRLDLLRGLGYNAAWVDSYDDAMERITLALKRTR
jgi:hypothetical protein